MIKSKKIVSVLVGVMFIASAFLFLDSFNRAEEEVEKHGYTVIDKKLSLHSIGRPYRQYKDDVIIMLTLEKDGETYQGYYQERMVFLKRLYVSNYTLENKEEYLSNAEYSSAGSKHNFHRYK